MLKNKTYILLHGAWHASWCWQRIVPILMEQGHSVIAPNLPGHGDDKTAFSGIHLKTYVDFVSDIVTATDKPVTLVGHSMAGVIISQVAENMPDKIDQLIYVAAFIPENKSSLLREAGKSKSPGTSTEVIIDEIKNEITLKKTDRLKELFFNACDEREANQALALLQKEPFQPFTESVKLSQEKFGKIKKRYIECLKDEVLKPEDQKRMYTHAGCDVMSLPNADHSPFFLHR